VNKRQLIAAAARRTLLTQRQTGEALEAVLETIAEALASGEPVVLSGFGRFETRRYPGRKLRRYPGRKLRRYPGRKLRRLGGDGYYPVADRLIPVFRSAAALRRRLRGERS
jgi:nucleoid DNA-binding protein